VLSAVDPLNLVGILTPEARVAAVHRNRILIEDGVPLAALEGGEMRRLADSTFSDDQLRTLLARRSLRQPLQQHFKAAAAYAPPSGKTRVRSSIFHH
jgi:ATP-dependent helicase Lhr and Lhr-like helicase